MRKSSHDFKHCFKGLDLPEIESPKADEPAPIIPQAMKGTRASAQASQQHK